MTITSDLLRVYLDPHEIETVGEGRAGYPRAWNGRTLPRDWPSDTYCPQEQLLPRIPDHVRELAGNRCVRCSHPAGGGEWSPCDDECMTNDYHGFADGTWRKRDVYDGETGEAIEILEARWRILTVHHLNGIKHDCRWWNLVALCQRCHLSVQARVVMERPYHGEHSEWFRPYVAGFYAWRYIDAELTREETIASMDELLALEHRQLQIEED